MTPKDFAAWFAAPGIASITLTDTLDMSGITLRGTGKTVIGGTLKRARILATDSLFKGVTFDCAPKTGELWFTAIGCYADGSVNTTFDGCTFGGGNEAQGHLLRAYGTKGITVVNTTFSDGMTAFSADKSSDIHVENNTFSRLSDNAIATSGCDGVVIRFNKITGVKSFQGSHTDAIQSWTAVTRDATGKALKWHPCLNYTVTDNIIIQGDGEGNQGIFHRSRSVVLPNDVVDMETTKARNWRIADNLIYGWSHNNAIYMNEGTDGVTITGNLCLSPLDDDCQKWILLEGVTNANVSRNVADMFVSKTFTFTGNATTKAVASLIPDLNKRALATEAGLRLQAGGVRLGVV